MASENNQKIFGKDINKIYCDLNAPLNGVIILNRDMSPESENYLKFRNIKIEHVLLDKRIFSVTFRDRNIFTCAKKDACVQEQSWIDHIVIL